MNGQAFLPEETEIIRKVQRDYQRYHSYTSKYAMYEALCLSMGVEKRTKSSFYNSIKKRDLDFGVQQPFDQEEQIYALQLWKERPGATNKSGRMVYSVGWALARMNEYLEVKGKKAISKAFLTSEVKKYESKLRIMALSSERLQSVREGQCLKCRKYSVFPRSKMKDLFCCNCRHIMPLPEKK